MTRLEENQIIINQVAEDGKHKPAGTYDELVVWQLGVISTMLVDISKSLAVIASKAEGKGDENKK